MRDLQMRREENFLIFWKPDLLTRFDIFIPTKKESTHGGLIDSVQGLRMRDGELIISVYLIA